MKKNNKGFTLVELLTVVAIIVILSGIVYASLEGSRAKGRDAKRVADIQNTALALELYFNKHHQYPYKLIPCLESDGDTGGGISGCGGTGNFDNVFMPKVPLDPNGKQYRYHPLSKYPDKDDNLICRSYHLAAQLETNSSVLKDDADYNNIKSVDLGGGYTCNKDVIGKSPYAQLHPPRGTPPNGTPDDSTDTGLRYWYDIVP